MKKWMWFAIGGVVLLLIVAVGASKAGKRAEPVQLARLRTEDITSRVRAPGKIEARTQVKVSADVPGKITHLLVKEGDRVKKGQLMLQLDDTQFLAMARQARATLAGDRARLNDSESALKLAESNYDRSKAQYDQNLLSKAEWDAATHSVESARLAVAAAKEEIARSEGALAGAEDNLAKSRFLAPFDGVVSALNVEQGEIVITGTMNNPGTEILTVSDMGRMLVRADVDETDVVDMKLGQKAKITVDALPDTTFNGTVTEIGNTAKRTVTSTAEGQTNFEVKVVFDDNVPQVRPGMTADVEVATATHEKTQGVPIQAVVVRTERELARAKAGKAVEKKPRPGGAMAAEDDTVGRKDKEIAGVFVVREGVAHFVPVRTGIASETDIEVFGDLHAGDVVVAGPYKALRDLKPNAKVKQQAAASRGPRPQ